MFHESVLYDFMKLCDSIRFLKLWVVNQKTLPEIQFKQGKLMKYINNKLRKAI